MKLKMVLLAYYCKSWFEGYMEPLEGDKSCVETQNSQQVCLRGLLLIKNVYKVVSLIYLFALQQKKINKVQNMDSKTVFECKIIRCPDLYYSSVNSFTDFTLHEGVFPT